MNINFAHLNFAHPKLIILLAIPVALMFWEWVRRGQPLVLPFDDVHKRGGWLLGALVRVANCLPALLLGAAIVLLARPVTIAPPKTERKLSNIQIVLDTSPSMAWLYDQHAGPNSKCRFDAAMDAVDSFTTARQGDAFGLTIFARYAIHWVPLTQDVAAIRMARPFVHPKILPKNVAWAGTFIARALEAAITPLMRYPEGDRMIILLTDGEADDIRNGNEHGVVAKLRQNHITVFTVAMTAEATEAGMEIIARETGGGAFRAYDPQALKTVFERIDQMKKVEVRSTRPEVIDYLDPFLLPALGLLAAQVVVLFGLRFTPW